MRTQFQPGVGGRQSLGRAREQGHAQRAFEFVNMASHRRLGQTKLAGGPREIALAQHREKGTPPLPADVVFHYAKMYSGYTSIANLFWPNPGLIVQSCCRGAFGGNEMKALELSPGRPHAAPVEYVPVIVIGGGQAGLSVGYHLARRGVPFVILDAGAEVGDSWRA